MLRETATKIIFDSDMPAIFRSADKGALRAQRQFLWVVRVELALLIAVAIVTAVSIGEDSFRNEMAGTAAAILSLTIILTSIRRIARPERQWYESRALAESVKTVTWRYMMCAEPYRNDVGLSETDQNFGANLLQMLEQQSRILEKLGGQFANDPQITEKMRSVRTLDSEDRKDAYLSGRVQDQRNWYSAKAEVNRNLESRWFVAIVTTESLALISAITFIIWSDWTINFAAIFSGLAVAFLAWLQIKKHNELAQSYAMAAHELGLINDQALHVHTEEELSKFVSDSENAMSREHTMWLARKDAS